MARVWAWSLLLLLPASALAGCSQPGPEPGDVLDPEAETVVPESHVDDLTERLVDGSGPFFPSLLVLDRVDLPAGGNISFSIGEGMRCDGNATGYANATGWLECSVRLVDDPSAVSRDRRALGIGFDYQVLTARTATGPVEWRVELAVLDAGGNVSATFDSGWRGIDLTPVATSPVVTLMMDDPCDRPVGIEEVAGKRGTAALNVSFTAGLVEVTLAFEFGPSQSGGEGAASHRVLVDQQEHHAVAIFPKTAQPEAMWIRYPLSIETEAMPPTTEQGPCTGAFAHEVQEWTVAMAYGAADLVAREHPPVVVPVDVYLSAQ